LTSTPPRARGCKALAGARVLADPRRQLCQLGSSGGRGRPSTPALPAAHESGSHHSPPPVISSSCSSSSSIAPPSAQRFSLELQLVLELFSIVESACATRGRSCRSPEAVLPARCGPQLQLFLDTCQNTDGRSLGWFSPSCICPAPSARPGAHARVARVFRTRQCAFAGRGGRTQHSRVSRKMARVQPWEPHGSQTLPGNKGVVVSFGPGKSAAPRSWRRCESWPSDSLRAMATAASSLAQAVRARTWAPAALGALRPNSSGLLAAQPPRSSGRPAGRFAAGQAPGPRAPALPRGSGQPAGLEQRRTAGQAAALRYSYVM
jgi:hypothetical protein